MSSRLSPIRRQPPWLAALALAVLATAACGGKRPVVARNPVPPAPAPTSRPTGAPPTAPAPGTTASSKPSTKPLPPNIPPAAPGSMTEEGLASWYGVPYHGRKASNGEVYDMHKMTAAHRTLPFNSVVRVTNMKNGRQTEVRINDRGPFVEGRVIDLSLAAAKDIDMVGMGVAPVRLELLSGPHPTANQYTVQIGAFSLRENAVRLRQSLERNYQPVLVDEKPSDKGTLYRVRVGRVASEAAAQRLADRLRREQNIERSFVLRLDE